MSSLRQLGSGLVYALVSVVLVVGGLSLALAEGGFTTPPATAQSSPSLVVPSSSPAASETSSPIVATVTPAVVVATVTPTPSATAQPLIITATPILVFPTTYASPRPTSTHVIYRTAVPCGPFAGWLLSYTVQPGDTLYHIATQYRTTVNAIQIANCKPTTVIFPGERLWVPNVPTVTPGVTLIPTFPSQTALPTEPPTLAPLPTSTDTAVPTDTPTDTTIPPNP